MMKQLSKEVLEKVIKAKNYTWFEDRVNIIGVRTKDLTPNTFNDYITISYKDKSNKWIFLGFEATTDPGLYWLNKPMNVKGTAIVKEGQYKKLWRFGLHSGYKALIQINPIKVYRDNNRDNYFNLNSDTIEEGLFTINCHRAHLTILQWVVEKYSAGCQVFRKASSFDKFYKILEESEQLTFDYTLVTEQDIELYG